MTVSGLQQEIVAAIKGYLSESPENRFSTIDGSPIFQEPLIGFADGDDPLFVDFKVVVNELHLTPREALQAHLDHLGDRKSLSSTLSVISFVLPSTEETVRSNAERSYGPSVRWNQTRWYGEDLLNNIKRYVVGFLRERGYRAASPSLEPYFQMLTLENGRASNWSERHVAYAAGLGTFGLSDALITARGVAHRAGSVVVEAALPSTPRPYRDHHQYCPFFSDGSCGVCIDRCPAGALTPGGHDKFRCRDHLEVDLKSWVPEHSHLGYVGTYVGCGLCMTGVPCEMAIPPGVKVG